MEIYQNVTPESACAGASDLKPYLFISSSDTSQDAVLTRMILGAQDLFTNETDGRVLMPSTWKLLLDHWPQHHFHHQPHQERTGYAPSIYITLTPVSATSLVEYLDPTATWQTLDGATWSADFSGCPARVILPQSLPALHPTIKPAVRVSFAAGYQDISHVPPGAVETIFALCCYKFEHRGEDSPALPAGWYSGCSRFSTGFSGRTWNE